MGGVRRVLWVMRSIVIFGKDSTAVIAGKYEDCICGKEGDFGRHSGGPGWLCGGSNLSDSKDVSRPGMDWEADHCTVF